MQKRVKDFNEKNPNHANPLPITARLMDISSELGELAKEYLKGSHYGTSDFKLTEDFILEYGDTLYSLLSLANEIGINANSALSQTLDKYNSRISQNSTVGSKKL